MKSTKDDLARARQASDSALDLLEMQDLEPRSYLNAMKDLRRHGFDVPDPQMNRQVYEMLNERYILAVLVRVLRSI